MYDIYERFSKKSALSRARDENLSSSIQAGHGEILSTPADMELDARQFQYKRHEVSSLTLVQLQYR